METRETLADEVSTSLARRHSTATVLVHHALAERLGLGPTDHKCLDVLRDRGPLTGSELARVTGLTTGAVTGVVDRLERSGRLHRAPHPTDGRKQVLRPTAKAVDDVRAVIDELDDAHVDLLEGFDAREVAAVHRYLTRSLDLLERRTAVLRAARNPRSDP